VARETLSHGAQKIQALHLKFIMTRIEVLLTWTFIKIRSVQEMSFFCFSGEVELRVGVKALCTTNYYKLLDYYSLCC